VHKQGRTKKKKGRMQTICFFCFFLFLLHAAGPQKNNKKKSKTALQKEKYSEMGEVKY